MPKRILLAQLVDIADLRLRQDVVAKIGLMNRPKKFPLGQQPEEESRELRFKTFE